ncbi:MAG: hypothetical protein ACLTMO_11380, partial [Faecalibacterium prausnitzii]
SFVERDEIFFVGHVTTSLAVKSKSRPDGRLGNIKKASTFPCWRLTHILPGNFTNRLADSVTSVVCRVCSGW